MAFVVRFELVDDYNRPASKEFEMLPSIVSLTAAEEAAEEMAAAIAGISELRVLAYTISQRYTFVDTVTAGANRDEGVTFTLRKEDLLKGSLKMFGPVNSIFDDEGKVITSPSLPALVTDFIGLFFATGPLATGTSVWTFSDGEQAAEYAGGTLDK